VDGYPHLNPLSPKGRGKKGEVSLGEGVALATLLKNLFLVIAEMANYSRE